MHKGVFHKTISIFLIMIFTAGLFPVSLFSQPNTVSSFNEIKGFNKSVLDSHFSRADRQLSLDRWLEEAKRGLTQAIYAWELTADKIYDNPFLLNEAKNQLEKLSNEELEKRFSQWLLGRFFGEAAGNAVTDLLLMFDETQKNYSWHLDDNGSIVFDDITGDPMIIRPDDTGREFSEDLLAWKNESKNIISKTINSFDNIMIRFYPELLSYIPLEQREKAGDIFYNAALEKSNAIKMEFENIAVREESIFYNRRTRDIWSLRKKSEDQSARLFTEKLIAETEESCGKGIDALNEKIEQAAARTGDLALLGEEWLQLYKEQFDRGLRAWEEAEERFFIRRIEWEQESFRLYSEGEETWLAAFNQFDEERQKWELSAKELFSAGEKMFMKLSEDFQKNITEAKKEFELNMEMRIGEGTTKIKATIDMYLVCASAAVSAMDNLKFWYSQYNVQDKASPGDSYFSAWLSNELIKKPGNAILRDMQKAFNLYSSYMDKAIEVRNRIQSDYAELLGTGMLKDILLPGASSEDFCLDEYQIALIKAKALVLYWERRTGIAEAVLKYADELSAERMTEAEGIRAWEEAKSAYNASLVNYEMELKKLYETGENIKNQQDVLQKLSQEMLKEEEKLNLLNQEYKNLITNFSINRGDFFLSEINYKYNYLSEEYNKLLAKGKNSGYFKALEYGMIWGIAEQRETAQGILDILEANEDLSDEEIANLYNEYYLLNPAMQEEMWRNTCDSLSELFGIYGFDSKTEILPDIKILCDVIFQKPGDFTRNFAGFLQNFDKCFLMIPHWLDNEITNWKNSLIQYISAYALFKGFKPEKRLYLLNIENEKLITEYNNLYNYIISLNDDEDLEMENYIEILMEIRKRIQEIYYICHITQEWEKNYSIISSENGTHWRQFLDEEYIAKKDQNVAAASSYQEGIIADVLFTAKYHTNRVNDSFLLYSQRELYETNKPSEYFYGLYIEEYFKLSANFNSLDSYYFDLIESIKMYELTLMTPNELEYQKIHIENEIAAQNNIYSSLLNQYLKEAEKFIEKGFLYDTQYSLLNKAYENTEQKRFEYEKQDAIRRWASTAYLNTDNNELITANEKLSKAQVVLEALSDLYNNESKRSYNNTEYNSLYSAYQQSFSRKLDILNAVQSVVSGTSQEYTNNANLLNNYQNTLNQLGNIDRDYAGYYLPSSRDEWTVKNIITVKDGKIVFSRDDSMKLIGVDKTDAVELDMFFNDKNITGNNKYEISLYEESLRGLSQRMSGYFQDSDKFKQWSLARDYLITSLIYANGDLSFLNNYFSGAGEIKEGGSLNSLVVENDFLFGTKSLEYYLKYNSIFIDQDKILKEAWNTLSENEKADLEFYIIMTLSNDNREYFSGFSQFYTYDVYYDSYEDMSRKYRSAKSIIDNPWLFYCSWVLFETRDISYVAMNSIETVMNETKKNMNAWINGLNSNLLSINKIAYEYEKSCQLITELEGGSKISSNIEWTEINLALINTGKFNNDEIKRIKSYWDVMRADSGAKYSNIADALTSLLRWANQEEEKSKNALDKLWIAETQNQQKNDLNFNLLTDAFLNGTVDKETLKSAAEKAYGKNAAAWKNHVTNLQTVMLGDISLYTDQDSNFYSEFDKVGNELTFLAENILEKKYLAELTVRENEWNQSLNDIMEKYYAWQKNAALILERGRTDWNTGLQKMEQAYKQWNINFQNEYARVSDEWQEAYLAGLEDKEKWLLQAANAANQASSGTFLSFVGVEGERLSRFIDTREPFGIRGTDPQTGTLMAELLQSSGIINMSNAFKSFNNITGTSSSLARAGIGGAFTWDTALVKTAASELARKSNAEISDNETRILAYNVNIYADEAVRGLIANVDSANANFRANMDEHFILNGLWRRSGDNYVKDIIKGSTIFTPVITETVTVAGYQNYIMEPIILKTNLDEKYLTSLNSIAIRCLLDNALNEVSDIAAKILGIGENAEKISGNGEDRVQSPGIFGAHIGYSPAVKPSEEIGLERNEIFYDEGAGELGRLMSEYIYWYIIDAKGNAELFIAPWDKRIWNDDGSWFKSPSLRTVGTIAGSIVAGVVTGGAGFAGIALTVAIGSASDIVFGSLDVAFGYKSWDEAVITAGKSLLVNTASALTAGVFNGFGGADTIFGQGLTKTATNAINGTTGKIFTQTMMSGLQTFTTGFSSNLINSVTYDSKNGFGYSTDAFKAGMNNLFTNTLTTMTSVLTSTSLTAINSGLDMSKLIGFNKLNQSDLQKLNGLLGSLAGQGVNYAMGNDFTLNILNLSLLSGNKNISSGLLELHLGRGGVSMNIGTGGANVSFDNIFSAINGAAVWNVNNRISSYGSKNDFDALIALRAQYGYGDDTQKNQLKEILRGGTIINTEAEGYYYAQTIIDENGKKIINLAGYENGMSSEDQFRLAVILGHEAYRDGYGVLDIDASGDFVTSEKNMNELRNASIARLAMGDRINDEHSWFYYENADFDLENYILRLAVEEGDMSIYDEYLRLTYYNDDDYFFLAANTGGDHQNQNAYKNILLFDAYSQNEIDRINENRRLKAYDEYIIYETYYRQGKFDIIGYDEFISSNDQLKKFGYRESKLITLHSYGCRFFSVKYTLEALLESPINAIDLHNFVKNNKLFSDLSLLSKQNMVDIISNYTEGLFYASIVNAPDKPSIERLYNLDQSSLMYAACLMVDNGSGGDHFVMLSDIDFNFDDEGNPSINRINVANPWNSKGVLGKQTYLYSEIKRWDIFFISQNDDI